MHTVTLLDNNSALLGSSTTIAGGQITAANGVQLSNGDLLSGNGTVAGDVSGLASSTITASGGALALGDAGSLEGFQTAGTLNVGANAVTLNDSLLAQLGSSTTLAGGSISSGTDVRIDGSDDISGNGTINPTLLVTGFNTTLSPSGPQAPLA